MGNRLISTGANRFEIVTVYTIGSSACPRAAVAEASPTNTTKRPSRTCVRLSIYVPVPGCHLLLSRNPAQKTWSSSETESRSTDTHLTVEGEPAGAWGLAVIGAFFARLER